MINTCIVDQFVSKRSFKGLINDGILKVFIFIFSKFSKLHMYWFVIKKRASSLFAEYTLFTVLNIWFKRYIKFG